jgi:hypothetical protein
MFPKLCIVLGTTDDEQQETKYDYMQSKSYTHNLSGDIRNESGHGINKNF